MLKATVARIFQITLMLGICFALKRYGKWANLLSENPNCEYSHMKNQCPSPKKLVT